MFSMVDWLRQLHLNELKAHPKMASADERASTDRAPIGVFCRKKSVPVEALAQSRGRSR